MFTESELEVLGVLEGTEGMSIKEIAEALETDSGHASRTVGQLEEKGLVEAERGRRKEVRLGDNKTAEIYQKTTEEHPHVDFPELLKGKAVPVLYCLGEARGVSEVADETGDHRRSVHRIIKKLLHRGIVEKKNNKYQLKKEFQTLNEFAEEYVHHLHRRKSEKDYMILWESLDEFLVQSKEEIGERNFLVTGPALFERFGIPLLTKGRNHYFYTEKKREITPAELVCHMLLIDKGTRYQSYCLFLMGKEGTDREELMREGEKYGVLETVRSLNAYLESRGKEKGREQPKWRELKKMAEEYGVEI